MTEQTVIVETRGRVGVMRINRPRQMNALNSEVITQILAAVEAFDADPEIGAMVLAGDARAFAAGADIKEMAGMGVVEHLQSGRIAMWQRVRSVKKPIIAAVSGFCLGGGCELAMMCDMIVASETATFGQPEINLGIMPGAGGTQRLTRAVGKALAMEMVLERALHQRAGGAGPRAGQPRRAGGALSGRGADAGRRDRRRARRWPSSLPSRRSTRPSRPR